MKKIILLVVSIFLALGLCSCSKDNDVVKKEINDQVNHVVPYKINSDGEKSYIEDKNGVPVLLLSTEVQFNLIKDADQKGVEDCEKYFKLASDSGFNAIEVPVQWSMIEKEENKFDFTWVKGFLDYAKKYDLMVDIIWLGSITDGQTHTANMPDYIYSESEKYSQIANILRYGAYGDLVIMNWADEDLLSAESYAIYQLFNYVGSWATENKINPVVTVQIGQGCDRFVRWRVEQYELLDEEGQYLDQEESWKMINNYIERLASAVKKSSYRPLTRVEFCEQNAVTAYVRNIKKLESIDLVCPTYLHAVVNTISGISNFVEEYPEMPVLNVENWAKDINNRQVLATIALGGTGYVSYQLSNPTYYNCKTEGDLYRRYDYENQVFTEINTRAKDTKDIILGLEKAYVPAAKVKASNFVTLGLNSSLKTEEQKVYSKSGVFVTYNKAKSGIGFMICDDKYVYVYSTVDAFIELSNVTATVCTKGYFDANGEWFNEGNVELVNNTSINMTGLTLYRIRLSQINAFPTEIPAGFLSSSDSIRG